MKSVLEQTPKVLDKVGVGKRRVSFECGHDSHRLAMRRGCVIRLFEMYDKVNFSLDHDLAEARLLSVRCILQNKSPVQRRCIVLL